MYCSKGTNRVIGQQRRIRRLAAALFLVSIFIATLSPARSTRAADPPPSVPGTQNAAPPIWHSPDANRLKFGIAGHMWWLDARLDEFMAYYHLLGITNVRLSLDWKTFEPQPGQYDFSQFDPTSTASPRRISR